MPATSSPTATAPSTIRLRVIPSTRRRVAAAVWRSLEADVGAPGLACSWAWTSTWLEHYGDVVDHRFVVGERDGLPRAIALVTYGARRPLRPRTVHVGTAGEPAGSSVFVERNRLLAAPEDRRAFAEALAASLRRDRGWDRLLLDGLVPADAADLLSALPAAQVRTEECPVTDLTAGDDVLDALDGSQRRRVQRTLRAFGPLDVEWATTGEQARSILDELVDLHQRHWRERGEPGAFASRRFAAFHRTLVARLLPRRQVSLVRVRRSDETVACLYGLIEGRRLLFYQGGLRRYDDNKLRAGHAAHALAMRACRERGITHYDFLAPATRYKQELANTSERLVWASLERRTWRTQASHAARSLRRSS